MTSIEDKTLPHDWLLSPIREVTVRTSQRDPRKQPDKNFRYVDVSSVDNTLFKVRGDTSLKGSEAPSRARKDIRVNDVLFATVRPTLKRVALIPPELDGEIASTGYCVLRPNPNKIEPAFLYSCVLTDSFIRAMGKLERGASYPAVRDSDVFAANIPIPPLVEQRKIAGVLGLVQRALEQQERLIALTTELKKTLLHQLFTQGLRGEPQKQTEIGPVPESWEMVLLEGVAKIERGKFTHRPRNEPRFYGGQTPFVQTGDVSSCDGRIREYSQTLNEEGVLISKVFPAGTILITIAANIGFSGILEFDSACPDSLIGLTPNERIDVEFLQHYLTTQQPVMDRLAPRGTQKNINIQFLKPWLVPLPSSDEQSEIREALNAVDSKVRVTRRKYAALTALFRTLLHQLMTAHILVTDLDIMEQFDTGHQWER
jgi:type I restriction enzyme S subunit